jgi:hypothetical protein
MAAYGKGQMLGSGINPESFKLDFGGFADAARMQAQGLSNLGQSIGGAIQNYGEVKKEQKKVDAYNKASAKSIEAAITLGKSYQIKGVEETLNPFLESYNDPNLSPIEKAALLDEGKAMIPNVFGRFDKNQAMLIEQAQNAPAPAEPFRFTGSELKKTDKGGLYVLKGNDGLDYDPKTKLPIFDLAAFGEGLPPEVFSAGAIPAANPIDGALNMFPNFNGNPGSMPPVGTPNPLLPALTPQDQAAINGILAAGQLAPQVGEPPASIARPKPAPQYPPRFIPNEPAEQGVVMTEEEAIELKNKGFKISGRPLGNGKVFVTNQDSLAPQQGQEIITNDGTTIRSIALGGKAEALAKAKRASEFEETRQTNFIIDKANEAEEIIDYSISKYGPGTLVDVAKSTIPGTQEYKLKNQILPAMKDSIALSSLKQLKAASPTGASGLGSLTEKEGKRLENMYGVLDVGGDKVTLKNDIKRLKQTAFDYIHGSKKEREEALANGDITKAENDQVEQMYREQILGVTAPAAPTATPYTGLDDETKKALKDLGVKIDE